MDLNHHTGGAIEGWPEVMQSILTILSTRIGSRVFQREFGSEVPALVDAPMNESSLMDLYVAVAEAVARWEPRFDLQDVKVTGREGGAVTLELTGNYLPKAHLGDFAAAQDDTRAVRIQRDRVEKWSLAA